MCSNVRKSNSWHFLTIPAWKIIAYLQCFGVDATVRFNVVTYLTAIKSISLNLFCRLHTTLYFTSALHQIIFVLLVSIHYILCQSSKVCQQCHIQIDLAEQSQTPADAGRHQDCFWGAQNCIIQTSLALSQNSIESGQWKILSFDLQTPLCIQVSEQSTSLDTDK